MLVKDDITRKLQDAFAPESVEVVDESDQHHGHAGHRPGGQTHFRVYIVSKAFAGKSRLDRHRIHGDLSPFNILWWQGRPWIIDFPQAVDARMNANSYALLCRDVENVCRFFAKRDVPTPDPWKWATRLQDIAGFRQEGLADADALLALMFQDKKVKRGKLTFILLKALGQAVIVNDVEPEKVRSFLARKLA